MLISISYYTSVLCVRLLVNVGELLSLLPLVGGVTGYCKVSTTTNPKYDWCGIVPTQGEPNVCGVAEHVRQMFCF